MLSTPLVVVGGGSLDDLSDVVITTPTNGEVLGYDGTKWINTAQGSSGTLVGLSDVDITGASEGQTLTYDGTEWVNSSEVKNARGGASTLSSRLTKVPYKSKRTPAGEYFDNSFTSASNTTTQPTAQIHTLYMSPFVVGESVRIDEISIVVTTQGTNTDAQCKLFIYEANTDGDPDVLTWAGANSLDCSTTGVKTETLDITLQPGKLYWLGLRRSAAGSTITFKALNNGSSVSFGVGAPATTSNPFLRTYARNTTEISYTGPLPNPFNLPIQYGTTSCFQYYMRSYVTP